MMRVIRVLNFTKKNPCIFQNQCYKTLFQQATKMSISSDALKEKVKEESLNEVKKESIVREQHIHEASHTERKILNSNRNDVQLPKTFSGHLLHQNKENLLKIIMDATPSNAVLLMRSLCSNRARPVDLLKGLSEKLQSNPPTTLLECSTVLYCAAVLNFRDLDLIKKIGEQIIIRKSDFVSHKLPTNIMKSLGVLKYYDQELLEALMGSILFHKPEIPEDLVTSLMTLALVNIKTPYTKSLIQLLSNYEEVDYSHPEAYLNFVWSCVILNELNPKHISRVLSEDFIEKIADNGKQKAVYLKLQNIHGAASCLIKSYSGPLLKAKYLYSPIAAKSKALFLEAVKNSLYYICPKEGFLKFNVPTDAGFLIDVGCNVSPQGEIVRSKHNDTNVQVGVILLDYHDFCLGNENMTGISAFKGRIVQAKGYKALIIPYTEFSVTARLSEKIDYLRKKFRSVV